MSVGTWTAGLTTAAAWPCWYAAARARFVKWCFPNNRIPGNDGARSDAAALLYLFTMQASLCTLGMSFLAGYREMPVESLTCWDYNAPEGFNPPPGGVDSDGGSRRLRSLSEHQEGRVAVPRSEFKQCAFYSGSCDYSGPLAGIECSGGQ